MLDRAQVEGWIRRHRRLLLVGWVALGAAMVAWLALIGPDAYYLRGVAPWPRRWAILFFLAVWGWAALRFIALRSWAWVALAPAPVSLFIPVRFYLDAWWLLPLLAGVGLSSTLAIGIAAFRLAQRTTAPRN